MKPNVRCRRFQVPWNPSKAMSPLSLVAASAILAATALCADAASGPIGISQNGRYFVTAKGEPFYFLADTQWELFRRYSIADARMILENRKAKGFTAVMVMLTGVGDGTGPNLDGEHPWLSDNPATPNPACFAKVDAVVELARTNDIQLLIGLYHQTYGRRMTVESAKPWAAWVTARYREQPNIIWTMYPRATDACEPIVRQLAAGIQEGDRGRHLVSMHPDPSPASSSFMHAEPWLGFNSIQAWNRLGSIYPMTLADYQRTPARPATMLVATAEVPQATSAEPAPAPNVQSKLTAAQGPLRVHPANPRYFADGSGKAILLTGSHTWGNLQDYRYATLPSPPPTDFGAYLAFLRAHHHNFFRLWAWETAFNPDAKQGTTFFDPMPHERPGPGEALDGKPKFDLTRFNPAYFDRLRARVKAARDSGVYVSVMLFNGFSIEGKGNDGGDPWQGHPFNSRNNANAIDGGGSRAIHTLTNPVVTAHQEAYVRKVIDTVNDLDNVLYEITNEDTGTADDIAWQYHLIRYIKQYEATKPKQHPAGMTACWPDGDDATLLASPADWISPAAKLPMGDGRKVILNDTDHSYFWIGLKADGPAAQRAWVWENFTRGNQCLFMDPYLDPSHDPGRNHPTLGQPDHYWDTLRQAMGETLSCAERVNLASMRPHAELASTGFCLADPGREYLVYLPQGGEVTVDLRAALGQMSVEWLRAAEGMLTHAEPVLGGSQRTLRTPFDGDAVLHLWSK
jgi:hypothetical protein